VKRYCRCLKPALSRPRPDRRETAAW
jgi:hypothetical protein